jgi:hypothetical protein
VPLYEDPNKPRSRPVGGGGSAPAASPAGAMGATSPTPAAGAAPKQVGTGFVGFDKYFNANRQGAQTMANTVAGAVQQAGQAGQQAIQGAQGAFDTQTATNTLTYDTNRPQTLEEGQALSKTTYQGPKSWEEAGVDTGAVSDKVNDAQAKAANLATVGGRAALLRESYRSGPSTSGGSALDSALMGAAGGQRFAQLQGLYGGLSKQLEDARTASGASYEAGKKATAEAAKKYEGDLGQWQTGDKRGNPLPTERAPVTPGTTPKKRTFFDRLGHSIFGGG